jgi:hypothetical protein
MIIWSIPSIRNAPILGIQTSRSRVSPKAGVIWSRGNLRFAALTRSLGGISFDEACNSSQTKSLVLPGISGIISESVVGSVQPHL